MANIELNVVALGNFKGLQTELAALDKQIKAMNASLASNQASLTAKQLSGLSNAFHQAMVQSGQFTSKTVSLSTAAENLGDRLSKSKTAMNDYRNAMKSVSKETSLYNQLGQRQVAMQQSIVQNLGNGMARVYAQHNADLSNATTRSRVLTQAIIAQNTALMQGATKVINWGKNMQWAGRQLTAGLTMPVTLAAAGLAKMYNDIDKNLTRMERVYGIGLEKPTQAMLDSVRKDVIGLSKELGHQLGISATEVTDTAAQFAAAGLTGKELIGATEQAARMVVLGETDKQEAIKATIALQTAYKMETNELAEATNFFNAAQAATSTSMTDLIEAIPRTGPVIRGLGGTYKDMVAILTAMKEGGVPAGEAANAIKNSLGRIINPTMAAQKRLGAFGIDLNAIVNRNAGNLVGTLTELQRGLDGLSSLDRQRAIAELFGKFQFARMAAFMDNFNKTGTQSAKVVEMMGLSAADLAGIADEQTKKIQESASGRFKIALEDLKNSLIPMGEAALNMFTKLLEGLQDTIEFIQNLPGPIKSFIKIFGGIAIVAGPIIMITGLFGNLIGQIGKGLVNLRTLGISLVTSGVNPLKTLGRQFRMTTEDMVAESNATKIFGDSMNQAVSPINAVTSAINELILSLQRLEGAQDLTSMKPIRNVAGAAGAAAGGALSVAGNVIGAGGGSRVEKAIKTSGFYSGGVPVGQLGLVVDKDVVNSVNNSLNDIDMYMAEDSAQIRSKVLKDKEVLALIEEQKRLIMKNNTSLTEEQALKQAQNDVLAATFDSTSITKRNAKKVAEASIRETALLKAMQTPGFMDKGVAERRKIEEDFVAREYKDRQALLGRVESGTSSKRDFTTLRKAQTAEAYKIATSDMTWGDKSRKYYEQRAQENARSLGLAGSGKLSNYQHMYPASSLGREYLDMYNKEQGASKEVVAASKESAKQTKAKARATEIQAREETKASREVVAAQRRSRFSGSGLSMGLGMAGGMAGGMMMGSENKSVSIAGSSLMYGGMAASMAPLLGMTGPMGLLLGAVVGIGLALKSVSDESNRLKSGMNETFRVSDVAAKQFGITVRNLADVQINHLIGKSEEAKDAVSQMSEAYMSATGSTKNYIDAISDISDAETLTRRMVEKFYTNLASGLSPEQARQDIAAVLKAAGKEDFVLGIKLRLESEGIPGSPGLALRKSLENLTGNTNFTNLSNLRSQRDALEGQLASGSSVANDITLAQLNQLDMQITALSAKILEDSDSIGAAIENAFNTMSVRDFGEALNELGPDFAENEDVINTFITKLSETNPEFAKILTDIHAQGASWTSTLRAAQLYADGTIASIEEVRAAAKDPAVLDFYIVKHESDALIKSATSRLAATKTAPGQGGSGSSDSSGGDGKNKALDKEIKKNKELIDLIKKQMSERKKALDQQQRELDFSKTKLSLENGIRQALAEGNFLKAEELQNELLVAETKKSQEDTQNAQDEADQKRIDELEAKIKELEDKKSSGSGGSGGGSYEQDAQAVIDYEQQLKDAIEGHRTESLKAMGVDMMRYTDFGKWSTSPNAKKYRQWFIDQGYTTKEADDFMQEFWDTSVTMPSAEFAAKSGIMTTQIDKLRDKLAKGIIDPETFKEELRTLNINGQKEVDKWKLGASIKTKVDLLQYPHIRTSTGKIDTESERELRKISNVPIQFFKMGGLVKYAMGEGGAVSGPGGPTSDMIPAMLSNGEYVIKSSAVSKYGMGVMEALNNGTLNLAGLSASGFNIPSGALNASADQSPMSQMAGNSDSQTNVTINADFNITGASDPKKIADEVMQKIQLTMKKSGSVTRI